MSPPDSYRLMQIFLEVARASSFTVAAERLGMKPPAVSKSIAKLERLFGARLINRSTRSMSLTDAGTNFLRESRRIVDDIDNLQELVATGASDPAGTLRVSATPAFGQYVLAPLLPKFLSAYPRIRIELGLTDRLVDLHAEQIDVAIRSTPSLEDSTLFRLQLQSQTRVLVASPGYLATNGVPRSPIDLEHHKCLAFRANKIFARWRFHCGVNETDVTIDPVLISDNYNALLQSARGGGGIARLFHYQVADDLDRGSLKQILPEFELPQQNIFALYNQKRENSPKVDLFLNQLQSDLAGVP